MLLRSMLIAAVSTHRALLTPALSILSFFSKPRPALLSVEKNPFLHAIFKSTVYKHFCAGENVAEVRNTIRQIKSMGFKGVILTYAREVVVDNSTEQEAGVGAQQPKERDGAASPEGDVDSTIESWRQGVLETVSMLEEEDFLALKFTGAGPRVTDALASGRRLPLQMARALDDVCKEALRRRAAILVDAEQQFVQSGIDKVAIDLMRRYNRRGDAVIYNTYQAYLKATPKALRSHLLQAAEDNFTVGVKLVRGAYMATEPRDLINDTKQSTDDSYNSITRGLLRGQYDNSSGVEGSPGFPRVQLFLATHNKASALEAYEMQRERAKAGLPVTKVQYGQLLGMADEVSCTLLQLKDRGQEQQRFVSPEVYKCLSWGTLGDCVSYLLRRAVENRDAVSRTEAEYLALRREVWRRMKSSLGAS